MLETQDIPPFGSALRMREATFLSVLTSPEGYPAITYHDVVKVFWKHGGWYDTAKGFPCGSDTPGQFALPNHNVYGKYVRYARDMAGQKSGMVKETLLWYCRQAADGRFEPLGTWAPRADPKTFTYYRSP